MFKKSPHIITIFKTKFPEIHLPPSPTITRWRTWLLAVFYISQHIEQLTDVFNEFEGEQSICVQVAHSLIVRPSIIASVNNIFMEYSFLPKYIEWFQCNDLQLKQALTYFKDFEKEIDSCSGRLGELVKNKLKFVIEKNRGLTKL